MKHFILLFAALFFAASNLHAQDWAKTKLEKSPRHQEWVKVKHGSREVQCFVVYPEVKDKATAIVLIHEIFGLTDWACEMADELAAEGYIVIAPDLLYGSVTNGGTEELIENGGNVGKAIQSLPPDQITADLDAAVDYAAQIPAANRKVVVAGFCWGGGQSFRFATDNKNLKAAFVFYGVPPDGDDMEKINCPVYGFYAGNDARITTTVPNTTEAMKSAKKLTSRWFMTAQATASCARAKRRTRARRTKKPVTMLSNAGWNC